MNATIALSPDSKEIVIEGKPVVAPFTLTVEPQTEIRLRVAGPDSLLTVCMQPTVGAFLVTTDGPLGIIASVIDRLSGDPRTVLPIPAR